MSRGLAATVTVIGTALVLTVIGLIFFVPLVGGVQDFLKDLPATIEKLRASDELSWLADSGAAENVQTGSEKRLGLGARLARARWWGSPATSSPAS